MGDSLNSTGQSPPLSQAPISARAERRRLALARTVVRLMIQLIDRGGP